MAGRQDLGLQTVPASRSEGDRSSLSGVMAGQVLAYPTRDAASNNPPQDALLEQMGFSVEEIDRRLHLVNFTARDVSLLRGFAGIVRDRIEELVETVYEGQLQIPEIAAIINKPDRLTRLHGAMSRFISSIFVAKFDQRYVEGRLRIGLVHKMLGITPRLYMSAMATLQSVLAQCVDDHAHDTADRSAIKEAVRKCLLFDSQLVFDAYVHGYQRDMDEAREEVMRFASHLDIQVDALTRDLYERSITDALTGLYNRQVFHEHLTRELHVAKRYKLPLSLVYFDLNGFKHVNDTHGHAEGDAVLAQVGASLNAIVRSVDIGTRYGGDEFCIIMPRCDLDGVRVALDRLTAHFDKACKHDVTFSIGVVQAGPRAFQEAEEILTQADALMYRAKKRAREKPGHHVRWSAEPTAVCT
jgi:diguanylate cyclase